MIHVCMCCYDTTYCETCFNKYVTSGTLPYKKCDPAHQFVAVRGPPKDHDDTKVAIRDSIRDREEWLNSIIKAWELEEEWHPATTASEFATIDTVVENRSMKETGEEAP
jgi:hypothetical protein